MIYPVPRWIRWIISNALTCWYKLISDIYIKPRLMVLTLTLGFGFGIQYVILKVVYCILLLYSILLPKSVIFFALRIYLLSFHAKTRGGITTHYSHLLHCKQQKQLILIFPRLENMWGPTARGVRPASAGSSGGTSSPSTRCPSPFMG